jgi:hypothetical protein
MASIAQGLRFGLACAAASALALAVAGCSGESTRFNDNPFSTNGGPEATGSIQAAQTAPAHRVESRPLPPQTGQAASYSGTIGAAGTSGVAGGGKGMASRPLGRILSAGNHGCHRQTRSERPLDLGRRHPDHGQCRRHH